MNTHLVLPVFALNAPFHHIEANSVIGGENLSTRKEISKHEGIKSYIHFHYPSWSSL
jgi:hypothetical protein